MAAIIEREGRFLVVEEESDGKQVINQPAGHLEDNESLQAAAMREVLEETAWQFAPQAITGIYRWRHPQQGITTHLRVCFSGQAHDHDPQRTLDTGILRTHWMDRETLQTHNHLRSPLVLRCVDDYLAGHRYPLTLCSDIDTST